MNYLSIYNSIITRAISEKRRRKSGRYYEAHHIIPKCLDGTNEKSNIVLLTAREHFVCHQLLVKIYPGNHKLVFSMKMLTVSSSKHIRNNREYEWIRKLVSKTSSEYQKGKSYGNKFQKGHTLSIGHNNGMYGKNHSTETKKLQSKLAKERGSNHLKGIPKTEEYKTKMRESKQIKRYILTDPDGKEYTFDRIADASKFCGVSDSVLVKLAGNRYGFDHCRNWKISAINL